MNKHDLYANYYETTEIPMCIYTAAGGVTAAFPPSDTPFLPEQFIKYCVDDFELQKRDIGNPLVFLMDPAYFIGVAKLEQEVHLIFGPAGPFAPSQEQILSFSVNVIHPEKLTEFCNLMSRTPIVTYRKFINALSMAGDFLTQEKYIFISFITMITRAAIKGGMNHEDAFSLSDTYCQQMGAMTRVQDINALTYQVALDFCGRVAAECSRGRYSTLVNRLRDYISAHLHEDITLKRLSRHVGLCTRVVSLKFRGETGQSITDYMHRQRMREAAHLLTHSEYSISDICEFLNYGSQSYFTKLFKDLYSMTPQQYRMSTAI